MLKIKLYNESLMRFFDQGIRSPYIYPLYGLGELPQVEACVRAPTSSAAASIICPSGSDVSVCLV